MVRIGTGPPFWEINHANSAYFRLFLGYFRVVSATRPPPFGSRPLLFTFPGSDLAEDWPLWLNSSFWSHSGLTPCSHQVSCRPEAEGLLCIGGLAVVVFWRSPHRPLGSGSPRAGYSQRRKRKEKGERAALIFLPRLVWEPSLPLLLCREALYQWMLYFCKRQLPLTGWPKVKKRNDLQ